MFASRAKKIHWVDEVDSLLPTIGFLFCKPLKICKNSFLITI